MRGQLVDRVITPSHYPSLRNDSGLRRTVSVAPVGANSDSQSDRQATIARLGMSLCGCGYPLANTTDKCPNCRGQH